jgi:hypothetical protein
MTCCGHVGRQEVLVVGSDNGDVVIAARFTNEFGPQAGSFIPLPETLDACIDVACDRFAGFRGAQ